jgi:hypothetical protein
MSSPSLCNQIKTEYQNIKTLKQEFDLEYQRAAETGNLEKVKELRAELKQKRETLAEKLWPFKKISQKEFRERYEDEVEIFKRTGLLEELPNGKTGIGKDRSIDGKEYALPPRQEVIKAMRKEKEIFEAKAEQGFNQPLITPFAYSVDFLAKRYGELIVQKFKEGNLRDSEGTIITNLRKQGEGDAPENDAVGDPEYYPIWKWERYTGSDKTGDLVYFPKKFSKTNHQGKTKQAILREQGGFLFSLIEDLPNIPRATNDPAEAAERTKGGRRQLEAGQSPDEYLNKLGKGQYQNETGMTPEEQIIYAILHLEKTNQVIDDYYGKGSASYQLGGYFSASDLVPLAYWARVPRRAFLVRSGPGVSDSDLGARSAVRVKI